MYTFKLILLLTNISMGDHTPAAFQQDFSSREACEYALNNKLTKTSEIFANSDSRVIGYCKQVRK